MKALIVVLVLAFLVSPVFADATLTVSGTSQVPRYINSGDNVTMLNISLLAANSTINLTSILVNFSTPYTTVEANNISAFVVNVSIYNDTDGDGIFHSNDTTLFGSNLTFGNETRINSTNITVGPVHVGTSVAVRLLVVFRMNVTAPVLVNVSATMLVNTSMSALPTSTVNSTLYSSDLTMYNISSSVLGTFNNITTQPIINGTSVMITK